MSDKFKTVVTTQGMDLLNKAIANEKDLLITKAVASANAYSTDKLVDLNDENYKSASHNQETTINRISSTESVTLNFEIVFDGTDIRYDYTLNTVFLIAEVDGHERLFAVIKANQPQYMNAYEGGSRTNLQINFGLELANQSIAIQIDSAATPTLKHFEDLKAELEKRKDDSNRVLQYNIDYSSRTASKALSDAKNKLNANITNLDKKVEKTKTDLQRDTTNLVKAEETRAVQAEKDLEKQLNDQKKTSADKDAELTNRVESLRTAGPNLFNYLNNNSLSEIISVNSTANFLPDQIDGKVNFAPFPGSADAPDSEQYFSVYNFSDELKKDTDYMFSMTIQARQKMDNQTLMVGFANIDSFISKKEVVFSAKKEEPVTIDVPLKITGSLDDIAQVRVQSTIFKNDVDVFDLGLYEGNVKTAFFPYPGRILAEAQNFAINQIRENNKKIEKQNKENRTAPMSWILDRSTTPWTIHFDNRCALQFPEYATTATIYGYGYTSTIFGTEIVAFPLVYNVIRVAIGGITIDKFKAAKDGFDYWTPNTVVINPVQNSSKFDWTNAFGDPGTKEVSFGRKPVFARVMYELGAWNDDDVISVGAIRR